MRKVIEFKAFKLELLIQVVAILATSTYLHWMETDIRIVNCKNCGNQFTDRFCNHCGQAADTQRIDFKFILIELKKTFIQFNVGFFYTVKELFLNPGNFIRDYLEGKRIKYAKPFSFLLIVCGLNVLLYHYLDVNIVREDIESFNKDSTNDFVLEHYMQIQLAILPVYAVFSILFFKQKVYNFFEFVVIHTYLAGQRILLNLLVILLESYFFNSVQMILHIASVVAYTLMVWAYINLFKEQSKVKVLLKTLSIQALTFVVFIILVAMLVVEMR